MYFSFGTTFLGLNVLFCFLLVFSWGKTSTKKGRGIVVCAGEGEIFLETLAMIEQTRFRAESILPITVAHCSELSSKSIDILSSITDVTIMNICEDSAFDAIQGKLRGFFCKPAALLRSPYEETMLVDSDVVWFKNPAYLFDAPAYLKTGTLFFRDRWTRTKNKLTLTRGTQNPAHVMAYINVLMRHLSLKLHPRRLMIDQAQYQQHGRLGHPRFQPHPTDHAPRIASIDSHQLAKANAFWGDYARGQLSTSLDHWQVLSVCLSVGL